MPPTFSFPGVMSASGSPQAPLSLTSVFHVHPAQHQPSRALQSRLHTRAYRNPPSLLFKNVTASSLEISPSSLLTCGQGRPLPPKCEQRCLFLSVSGCSSLMELSPKDPLGDNSLKATATSAALSLPSSASQGCGEEIWSLFHSLFLHPIPEGCWTEVLHLARPVYKRYSPPAVLLLSELVETTLFASKAPVISRLRMS